MLFQRVWQFKVLMVLLKVRQSVGQPYQHVLRQNELMQFCRQMVCSGVCTLIEYVAPALCPVPVYHSLPGVVRDGRLHGNHHPSRPSSSSTVFILCWRRYATVLAGQIYHLYCSPTTCTFCLLVGEQKKLYSIQQLLQTSFITQKWTFLFNFIRPKCNNPLVKEQSNKNCTK